MNSIAARLLRQDISIGLVYKNLSDSFLQICTSIILALLYSYQPCFPTNNIPHFDRSANHSQLLFSGHQRKIYFQDGHLTSLPPPQAALIITALTLTLPL
jgi:hypothetical protein